MNDFKAAEYSEAVVCKCLSKITSVNKYLFVIKLRDLYEAEKRNIGEADTRGILVYDENDRSIETALDRCAQEKLAKRFITYGGMDLWGITAKHAKAIEVKCDRECKFLHRDKPALSTGSLGFELWSNQQAPRSEWTKGWLHGYLYPEDHYAENTKKAKRKLEEEGKDTIPPAYCKPDVFIYLLTHEREGELIPYAAISFEDTEALFEYLNEQMNGKLMPTWDIDPNTIVYEQHGRSVVFQNMLYVPLDELKDLPGVTITMGKDKNIPNETEALRCTLKTEQKRELYSSRVEYLKAIHTPDEERLSRQEKAERMTELKSVEDIYEFFSGFTEEEIEAICPKWF